MAPFLKSFWGPFWLMGCDLAETSVKLASVARTVKVSMAFECRYYNPP